MNSTTDNVNNDKHSHNHMYCYFCKGTGNPVQYNKSSKKTWCNICQSYWYAKQNKIKPVFEECTQCNDTSDPVRYYISSERWWCEMCQEMWQDDEYQSYLDDKIQEDISYRKMCRRFHCDFSR